MSNRKLEKTPSAYPLALRPDAAAAALGVSVATLGRLVSEGKLRKRLALALLLYTAARRSDVVHFGPQHIKNGRLVFRQTKTRGVVDIPVHPVLRAILDATPAQHLTFLTTAQGKPFTAAGFGNWFHDRVKAAGLSEGCSAHGLRKAASRRLAEASATGHEIMAVTGHRTLKEVNRYTEAANRAALADSAIAALGRRSKTET